jgi:hypothetical protein
MEEINFEKLHLASLDYIDNQNNEHSNKLTAVGKWYFLFLNKEDKQKQLYIPYFSKDFKEIAFNYIRGFTFLYHFIKNAEVCNDFTNACLFNIFDFNKKVKNKEIEDLIFSFDKSNKTKDLLIWKGVCNESVITSSNSFLPIFKKEELKEGKDFNSVANTFSLFKIIKEHKLIEKPIYVNLDNNVITFNNLKNIQNQNLNETLYSINKRLSRNDAINEYKKIPKNYAYNIELNFPYSIKPTHPLSKIGDKKFNLILKNRLAYQEIEKNDIYLTYQEISNKTIEFNVPVVEVVKTNHSKELHHLMAGFYEDWRNLEWNKFVYPFPKYWFLFINNTLSTNQWLSLFFEKYPNIQKFPILNKLKLIIEELISINWINTLSKSSFVHLYFPELSSNREKKYSEIFFHFKNGLNSNISVSHAASSDANGTKYFLDAFGTIDLVNKMNTEKFKNYKIIIPDFLFYAVNPYVRYSIFKYAYTPLVSESRGSLDSEDTMKSFQLIEKFNEIKIIFLKECNKAKKEYNKKYNPLESVEIEKEAKKEDTLFNVQIEDLDFSNDEELEHEEKTERIRDEKEESIKYIYSIKTNDEEFSLNEKDKILIKRNSIIESTVSNLKRGDLFLPIDSIGKSAAKNDNKIIKLNKLSEVASQVKTYKESLKEKRTSFRDLQNFGASYLNKYYYDKRFINSKEFHLPRRKKNWDIICSYLNISNTDRDISYVAWKGRSDVESLKLIYKEIIHFLVSEDLISKMYSEYCVNAVTGQIKTNHRIFFNKLQEKIENFTLIEFSKMILSNIINQLEFYQVNTIAKH